MNALVIERQTAAGAPIAPNIALRSDWPDPPATPPAGHVVVRTLASAFNHMDLWVSRGVPGLELTYPRVSGCDACGEVEALGPGVDKAWLGRRVVVNAAVILPERVTPDDPTGATLAPIYELIGEHHNGMHAQKFVVPASALAPVAPDADPVSAAAFGLCSLTAYSMMLTKAALRPGQTVLIPGIGGGVATCALAIARHLGCPVAVTSRHAWKLERAKAMGAALCVLDQGQDWSKDVRAWTGKRGVDLAVDSVGKAAHLNCLKSLARGGAYVTPGCTSGHDPATDLRRVFWNQLRLLGSTMGTADEFREVTALYRAGAIRPAIDQVFTPEQGAQAYARLDAGEQFGKIVIRWA